MATSKILDRYGEPIQYDTLDTPQTSRIGRFDNTPPGHPSKGLTVRALSRYLETAEQGDLQAQSELFEDMEEKDAHLFAEMSKRKRVLQTLDWHIEPPRNATADETAQAEFANDLINDIADFEDVLFDMADGIGKGFAALEMEWGFLGKTRLPRAVHFRPQAWFQIASDFQSVRLRDNTAEGAALEPFGWILHRHKAKSGYVARSGLYRVLVWPFLFKNYSVRDLSEFLEIYGLPMRVGKYPAGSNEKEKATLLRALMSLGHNAAGIFPSGMEIDFKEAADGTHDPFEAMIRWAESSMSKAILGGTLTSQADGKSSTNALGNVHNEVRHDLKIADARQLASTLTRDLVYPLLAVNWKKPLDVARLPRFVFDTREPEDIKIYAESLPQLVDAGVRIPQDWANEKLRIPVPAEKDAILRRPSAAATTPPPMALRLAALRAMAPPRDALDELVADMDSEWEPVLEPMHAALQALCNECKTLEEFQARLPELAGSMDLDALQTMLTNGTFMARLAGRMGDA
jgi:phage gp29-like protein